MKIDEISQPSTWMFAQLAAGKESQAPQTPRRRRFEKPGHRRRSWRRNAKGEPWQHDQRGREGSEAATPPKHRKRSEAWDVGMGWIKVAKILSKQCLITWFLSFCRVNIVYVMCMLYYVGNIWPLAIGPFYTHRNGSNHQTVPITLWGKLSF